MAVRSLFEFRELTRYAACRKRKLKCGNHVIKGLTWRMVATTVTFLLAKWVTGDVGAAVTIAGWEAVAKIFVYYLH